jgi:hypothetical protein
MLSGRYWLGYFPNNNLQNRAIGVDVLDGGDALGCHVGNYANKCACAQCGWLSLFLAVVMVVDDGLLKPPLAESRTKSAES